MTEQHYQDIAYGNNAMQTLDLYLPEQQQKESPLYIYYHGGGFVGGDKCCVSMNFVEACNKAGIAVASVNYRLAPDTPYPGAMEDGLAALTFLQNNATTYNIDSTRIAIGGGSAGAGIAFWIAFKEKVNVSCIASRGAQTSYNLLYINQHVSDTFTWHPAVQQFFMVTDENINSPEVAKIFSENHYLNMVTPDSPPVFISYNSFNTPIEQVTDPEVLVHHPLFGTLLKEQMDAVNVECVSMTRDDLADTILEEAVPMKLQQAKVEFLKKHLLAY